MHVISLIPASILVSRNGVMITFISRFVSYSISAFMVAFGVF